MGLRVPGPAGDAVIPEDKGSPPENWLEQTIRAQARFRCPECGAVALPETYRAVDGHIRCINGHASSLAPFREKSHADRNAKTQARKRGKR